MDNAKEGNITIALSFAAISLWGFTGEQPETTQNFSLLCFFHKLCEPGGKHTGITLHNPLKKNERTMNELEELLAWSNTPVPGVLHQLPLHQQQEVILWAKTVVSHNTEGLDDLYNAISMIVKYIPNFMVIPLMVEHIRPRIAAGVCIKMGVEQATGYANDLPLEYFCDVSKHLDATMMAEILQKMRRQNAEKFICHELKHHQSRILDIAQHLDLRLLEIVAKLVTFTEKENEQASSSHKTIIDKIRAMQ